MQYFFELFFLKFCKRGNGTEVPSSDYRSTHSVAPRNRDRQIFQETTAPATIPTRSPYSRPTSGSQAPDSPRLSHPRIPASAITNPTTQPIADIPTAVHAPARSPKMIAPNFWGVLSGMTYMPQ